MLEKNIKDIINAGIGLFKTGEDNIHNVLGLVEKTFAELRDRGAGDSSETALKIRETADRVLSGLKDVSDWENFSFLAGELQKQVDPVLEQLRKIMGEERYADLNSRVNELKEYIQKSTESTQASAGGDSAVPSDSTEKDQ